MDVCRAAGFSSSEAKAVTRCMATAQALPVPQRNVCKRVKVGEAQDRIECMLYLNWPTGHEWCSRLTLGEVAKSLQCMKRVLDTFRRSGGLEMVENDMKAEAQEICKNSAFLDM